MYLHVYPELAFLHVESVNDVIQEVILVLADKHEPMELVDLSAQRLFQEPLSRAIVTCKKSNFMLKRQYSEGHLQNQNLPTMRR